MGSDKGTIHIFKIRKDGNIKKDKNKSKMDNDNNDEHNNKKEKNPTSSLGLFKSVLPRYFSSEWSLAQFRVPDVRTIVAFGSEETTLVVVSSDGTFYKATFNPKNGGDCQKIKEEPFLKNNTNDYQ